MLRIGLYGINGHQIHNNLVEHPLAELIAIAEFPREKLPNTLKEEHQIQEYDSLEAMLANRSIDLVCLCSPRRSDQAQHAIEALEAGKHVYAEKPCALTEDELDAILAAAHRTGKIFHEMAGTAFGQPYLAMRDVVLSGRIGEVVQVISEKSYPYYPERAQDEELDGGLICQNGIHALRFIEHVAGTPIQSIQAIETGLGNPITGGGLQMASSIIARLTNGGVATVSCNYLNQPGSGVWGEEGLKILGTQGYVESRSGGEITRLVIGDQDHGPLDTEKLSEDWLSMVLRDCLGQGQMPITLESELSPTRWVIRAKSTV
ncbi:Gfo/Idh/MocA family protein [Puniceicoccus vermicola]|uniref:Gfo/Idh/MocA family oxidoreductase n=1 Tax=Puniceicoccus vermicola TaxID=388746 RepID=A0A7X1E470_9BACT|nr:Gfo/Idh/MocA family oxidoreductase [Puniceicoccus vermicola]MBC2601729.1 Gfo/Idh/MocA family oxidoreductase [Puniceicoccus vermicola]